MNRIAYSVVNIILCFLIGACIVAFLTLLVNAHEAPSGFHYPFNCCSERDCGPVKQWIQGQNPGQVTIVTDHGRAVITQHQIGRARQAPDGQAHACIVTEWQPDGSKSGYVRETGDGVCLWLGPNL